MDSEANVEVTETCSVFICQQKQLLAAVDVHRKQPSAPLLCDVVKRFPDVKSGGFIVFETMSSGTAHTEVRQGSSKTTVLHVADNQCSATPDRTEQKQVQ